MKKPVHLLHYFRLSFLVGMAFILVMPTLLAQNKSAITGRVTDSSGAVLQGARVELQPRGLVVFTGDQGGFIFTNVPPGNYTLSISSIGFEATPLDNR